MYTDAPTRPAALRDYDLWRRAYNRGLVTVAELTRFLKRYEAQLNLYQTFSTEELP